MSKLNWYFITIALVIATAMAIFIISEDAFPLVYIRWVLGSVFVLFLPGYAFVKALYPLSGPIKRSSETLNAIDRVILSVVVSITLTPTIGIILNFAAPGVKLIPVTITLVSLTAVFATIGLFRQQRLKS